ncbi:MAG: ATP-binding protein [Deltaproteobacteria bacterium]
MITVSEDEHRRRRREGFIIAAAGLAVLVFALWEIRRPATASATGNVMSFLIVNLNIVLLLVLVFLVLRNLLKLLMERRRGVMGSQLKSRMVLAFVTIALFPAVVMVMVSLEFVTNTIDSWFSREVEASLRGAQQLARTYYQNSADQAVNDSRQLGRLIERRGGVVVQEGGELAVIVSSHQRAYQLPAVSVFGPDGQRLASSPAAGRGIADAAYRAVVEEALAAGGTASRVERVGEEDVALGAYAVADASGSGVMAVVVVENTVDAQVRQWSEEILSSFNQYTELKLNKRPFKNLYILTMALASLVVVFSATWLGIYLARGITDPLGRMADATRRVAAGDWGVPLDESGGDEIATVMRSFNSMTAQLKASHEDLDERRRYIENVLANIEAGVVSVDEDGVISTVNPAAFSLLGLEEGTVLGEDAVAVFKGRGYGEVVSFIEDLRGGHAAPGARLNIEREEEGRTLLVTGTTLVRRSGVQAGWVLFFENVSQIVEIQRIEAWKEVARRIAHEIKNPLTPIQLSAQRMGRRLQGRLSAEDQVIIDDCIGTIIGEVDELKGLVNEFSKFSRTSVGEKKPHDINQLVAETLPLYRQSREDIAFDFAGGENLPVVIMNREAVRRALVNLLDNAVAAVARNEGVDSAITVTTRLDQELSRVVLEVADSGPGVAPEHRARVFEPYFSTKEEGTGLGLALVASVAADHHAYVRLHDNDPCGSRFVIEFPVGESQES